jgi:hypothetical protein
LRAAPAVRPSVAFTDSGVEMKRALPIERLSAAIRKFKISTIAGFAIRIRARASGERMDESN